MHRIPQIFTGGSLLLLQAACPPQQQPVTTDTTSDPGSSTSSGGVTDGFTSTTALATTTSGDVGTTADSTTMPASATDTGGTTAGDTSEGPIDPGCTYPGSTSGDAASPDVDEACACVQGNSASCGMKLCPTITGSCDRGGFDDKCHGSWKYSDDALACAITAAAAGTEGRIEWRFTPNGGFSEHTGFLHIVSDRRAIRQDVESVDLDMSVSDTELWNLEDPSWFEGCLELASFCERMDCFFAGTKDAALSLCQAGYDEYGY